MEYREEETASCRYISHRSISDSPSAQADLLFQNWVYGDFTGDGRSIRARRYSTRDRGCRSLFGRSGSGLGDWAEHPGGWGNSLIRKNSSSSRSGTTLCPPLSEQFREELKKLVMTLYDERSVIALASAVCD